MLNAYVVTERQKYFKSINIKGARYKLTSLNTWLESIKKYRSLEER